MSIGKGLSILGVCIFGGMAMLSNLTGLGIWVVWIGMFATGCMVLYKGE